MPKVHELTQIKNHQKQKRGQLFIADIPGLASEKRGMAPVRVNLLERFIT
jgi:hypothetical protein